MTGICKKGKKTSGAVKIPATFTYDGVKYKVVKIQDEAFRANKKITSVKIPSTVTEIGSDAFYGCSKLKTVTISKKAKLSLIGDMAFNGCTSLKAIYINAETVGACAFANCSSLAKVTFGDNVKEIGSSAFSWTAIKSIDFGKNITTVRNHAVAGCQQLEEITIGENVTTLVSYIDAGCVNLESITVKSTKLDADNCGSYYSSGYGGGYEYKAPFLNESGKETIRVPEEKLTEYQEILGEGYSEIIYKTF